MARGRPQGASFEWPAAWRVPHQALHDASHAEAPAARARPSSRHQGRAPVPPAQEIAFLASGGLHPATLAKASGEAQRLDVSADAALLAGRTVTEDAFYRALARHVGAAFAMQDLRLAPGLERSIVAEAGVVPLQRWPGGPRWLIAPRGRDIAKLASHGALRDAILTTPRRFEHMLREADAAGVAAEACSTVEAAHPGLSARDRILSVAAWPVLAMLAAAAALIAWIDPGLLAALLFALLWLCFAAGCVQRIVALFASLEPRPKPPPPLADRDLPIFTIIVALYREANMVRDLIAAMERLDYPRAKLDIKFVVEADDEETRAALMEHLPGVEYDIVVAPAGAPRTKPRALNVALPFARGELLTIYDAEDRPDHLQLRTAAAAFAQAPRDVACFQARLAIDNAGDGPVQALYALDYAALFAVFNRGLAFYDLPMFLGGSSNHFRRDLLVAAGGWDAWNVTEDADLGLRLARQGLRIAVLDSQTGEEAPPTLPSFLRQRTRWKKGWMQTLAVHFRDPRRLWRELGPLKSFSVLATFASGVLGPLLWPFFSAIVLWHAWTGSLLHPVGPLAAVRSTLICLLVFCGFVAMVGPLLVGAARQGLKRALVLLPLLPLWHVALCVAAWMAFVELFANPYRWAKTDHGLAKRRGPVEPAL